MWERISKECMYVKLIPFTLRLKLRQPCKSTLFKYNWEKKKTGKKNKTLREKGNKSQIKLLSVSLICIRKNEQSQRWLHKSKLLAGQ